MFVDTSVRPQGEQVDAVAPAKMKLSAAIRIGARLRPKCIGRIFMQGRTCALGAALEGRGFDASINDYEYRRNGLSDVWSTALAYDITLKNDRQKWTREQIADWLEAQGL